MMDEIDENDKIDESDFIERCPTNVKRPKYTFCYNYIFIFLFLETKTSLIIALLA